MSELPVKGVVADDQLIKGNRYTNDFSRTNEKKTEE
jgi:hypothetical protein